MHQLRNFPVRSPRERWSLAGWLVLGAPLILTGCLASKEEVSPFDSVNALVSHGQYAEAVEEASRWREEDPVSEEYEALHKQASLAYLLEQARRASFSDNDRLAISRLEDVMKLDPESDLGQRWMNKTRNKLATRLTQEGMELASNNQFQAAWNSYQEATQVLPDFPMALEAMGSLDKQVAHRASMGSEYYDQGVAALVEEEFAIASNRFGYVRKYRDEDERLLRRSNQVDKARSKRSLELGGLLEAERLFYAARAEFQLAVRFDPDNEIARQGVNRCSLEADVAGMMARGQNALTRGEFIRAKALLGEALGITQVQAEDVQGLLEEVEQKRLLSVYEGAVRLENDLRFDEAIDSFENLLVQAPSFMDAQERVAGLKTRVFKAADLYGRLGAETNAVRRLELLGQVEVLYPDYRDVPERIADLEKQGIKVLGVGAVGQENAPGTKVE